MSTRIEECIKDTEILATHIIAFQLYDLPKQTYLDYIKEMMASDYRLIAVFEDDKIIAISGFRVGRRLYCGRYLHIDNMIVDEKYRSQGIASTMIEWLKEEAKRLKCQCILADTYTDNVRAQTLFKKQDFQTRGYHLKFTF